MTTKLILTGISSEMEGEVYEYTGDQKITAGRLGRGCDLTLKSRRSSRRHCVFEIFGNRVTVKDFGSCYGTYVNEVFIGKRPEDKSADEAGGIEGDPFTLTDGDELRLGPTLKLLVNIESDDFGEMSISGETELESVSEVREEEVEEKEEEEENELGMND